MKLFKGNKKGIVAIYIAWFIAMVTILLIASVLAPMGVKMNTELYKAGEMIMLSANQSIQNISDTEVKSQINSVMDSAFKAQQNNIEVNAQLFQYGWVLVIFCSTLVIFLFTRRISEFSGGGFV